jgi:hypothetical protein
MYSQLKKNWHLLCLILGLVVVAIVLPRPPSNTAKPTKPAGKVLVVEPAKHKPTAKDERIESRKRIQSKLQKLQPKLDPTVAAIIANCVDNSAHIYDVDAELIMAVMFIESSCNPHAESVAGCTGLMQINYSVWKDELKLHNYYRSFQIPVNIDAGTRVLNRYRDKYGNWAVALDHYSGGKKDYSDTVLRLANKIVVME